VSQEGQYYLNYTLTPPIRFIDLDELVEYANLSLDRYEESLKLLPLEELK
jgi:hypothetical protein